METTAPRSCVKQRPSNLPREEHGRRTAVQHGWGDQTRARSWVPSVCRRDSPASLMYSYVATVCVLCTERRRLVSPRRPATPLRSARRIARGFPNGLDSLTVNCEGAYARRSCFPLTGLAGLAEGWTWTLPVSSGRHPLNLSRGTRARGRTPPCASSPIARPPLFLLAWAQPGRRRRERWGHALWVVGAQKCPGEDLL